MEKKKKDRPCELNQKLKRARKSRATLKINNRKKSEMNKKLRDRNVEIIESRDQWRARSQELDRQKEDLERKVQAAKEEVECERIRADEAHKRAENLQAEIETILKKKWRA